MNKQHSLAFHLAWAGYDVWLGNARGNKYSRGHEHWDEYWGDYWNFNIQDLAIDLNENIDWVLKETGKKRLTLVGKGHGATMAMTQMQRYPEEMDDKLNAFVALSPIAHNFYTWNEFYDMYSRYWRSLGSSLNNFGEVWGKGFLERLSQSKYNDTLYMFEKAFWDSFSASAEHDDPERIEAYMGHFPHGGVGAKLIDHLGQVSRVESYQNFDYNQLNEEKKQINNIIFNGDVKPHQVDFSDLANSTTPI